jgi:hypothetical protein
MTGSRAGSPGADREAAAYPFLLAPAGELPAQRGRRGRFDALGVDLAGGGSLPHGREEHADHTREGVTDSSG